MNAALGHCHALGKTHDDPGQLALSIREKLVRAGTPHVVFHRNGKIYCVPWDSATGANILHTPHGNRAWIATYTAKASRTHIRADLRWFQADMHGGVAA